MKRGVLIALLFILLTWARISLIGSLVDQGFLLTYIDPADRILAGQTPSIADVSPVYLWLIVVLRGFVLDVTAIRAMQIAALSLAAFLCALAAKRIAGWPAAIATAILVLGNRAALVVASELDPKALVFLLTSGALAAIVYRRHALAGFCLGLSAATHPYGYIILLLILAWSAAVAAADVGGIPPPLRIALASIIPIVLVLLSSPVEKHAGTQLYEGNNPLATGCAGVAPRVVMELQRQLRQPSPDPIYRMIAERAHANPRRYWRDKSLAFMRRFPGLECKLLATKALLTIHHFDVHDVFTARRRARELARYPAIPFGVAFVLAVAAFILRNDRRDLIPIALFAIALIAALTLFVVSARQRNVLLAPLSILGGIGAAEIIALLRTRTDRALIAFGAVLIATGLLGIETNAMREWDYMERTALRLPVDPASPPRLFDRALALRRMNRLQEAGAILATIEDYRPQRQNTAVSSVAFYRGLIDRAKKEAPADPYVLAASGQLALLHELYDPLTEAAAQPLHPNK